MKQKVSEIIFNKLSGVQEFYEINKLHLKYEKAQKKKDIKKMNKIKENILSLVDESLEGINRIEKIYSEVSGEIVNNQVILVYDHGQIGGFLSQLRKMHESVLKWKGELDVKEN